MATRLDGIRPRIIKQAVSPTREIGVTGLSEWAGEIYEQPLRQLQGSRAIKTWKEMSRYDTIIGAILKAVEMLIRGVPWRVDPFDGEAENDTDAEFLESLMDDMSHSWSDFISEVLTFLPFGFSLFEIVMKQRMGEQTQPGLSSRHDDGRLGIRKLAPRAQDTIDRWNIDDDGGIRAAIQRWEGVDYVIPIEKALLFRTTIRKNNPEGRSVLENSYVAYRAKKRIQEYEWIRVERDATGVPTAWVPPELLRDDASSEDQTLLGQIKKVVRDIKFNEQAGVVMPLVRDENGDKLYELELMASPGARPQQTGPIIERLNREMAMSMLADVVLLGHEKVGSFALASSKTNLLASALGAYLDSIQDVLNRHLVPRIFRWNGLPTDEMPQFKHGDVESVDMADLADYIQKIAAAGAAIFPSEDGSLERYLLENVGLPAPSEEHFKALAEEREEEKEAMRQALERQPNAQDQNQGANAANQPPQRQNR